MAGLPQRLDSDSPDDVDLTVPQAGPTRVGNVLPPDPIIGLRELYGASPIHLQFLQVVSGGEPNLPATRGAKREKGHSGQLSKAPVAVPESPMVMQLHAPQALSSISRQFVSWRLAKKECGQRSPSYDGPTMDEPGMQLPSPSCVPSYCSLRIASYSQGRF